MRMGGQITLRLLSYPFWRLAQSPQMFVAPSMLGDVKTVKILPLRWACLRVHPALLPQHCLTMLAAPAALCALSAGKGSRIQVVLSSHLIVSPLHSQPYRRHPAGAVASCILRWLCWCWSSRLCWSAVEDIFIPA